MIMKSVSILFLIFLFITTVSAQSLTKAEAAVRQADQDWLRVFAAKDLEKSVAFMTDDGSMLSPNNPIATGHEAVSKVFAGFFQIPDLKISWTPAKVEVARSGELAYTTGAYQMTFKDPTGKTAEDHGKYVTIWKKQKGQWKVAYDIFNSDLPAAP